MATKPDRPGQQRVRAVATAVLLAGAVLTGCSEPVETIPITAPSPSQELLRLPPAEAPTDPRQALTLVPQSATEVIVTNVVALRRATGHGDIGGPDARAEQQAFARQVRRTQVVLTDGLLAESSATLRSAHDFGAADVTFEVRFSGGGEQGFVLGFRAGQDMSEVAAAVRADVGPLAGARVRPEQRLVVEGIAGAGEPTWADAPELVSLTDAQAHTTYLHRGCLELSTALGRDAQRLRDRVRTELDLAPLQPLELFSVSFAGPVATGRLGLGRDDLSERADLAADWPSTRPVSFDQAFTGMPLFDTSTGRIGLRVADAAAAARATLAGILPFAVCAAEGGASG